MAAGLVAAGLVAAGAAGAVPAGGVAPSSPARECATTIPGLGSVTGARIKPRTTQVIVTAGKARKSSFSTIQGWRKADGCWQLDWSRPGRNGYAGWHPKPWDGSGLSPIGVYRLTDAGGRLPNPGTRLPYSHQPQYWSRGGFKMGEDVVQVFNYVVAINFNRFPGRSPRDLARPNPRIPDGGIWFHVSGAGATRGCVSLPQPDMIMAMNWLDPTQRPVMVMGPKRVLRR